MPQEVSRCSNRIWWSTIPKATLMETDDSRLPTSKSGGRNPNLWIEAYAGLNCESWPANIRHHCVLVLRTQGQPLWRSLFHQCVNQLHLLTWTNAIHHFCYTKSNTFLYCIWIFSASVGASDSFLINTVSYKKPKSKTSIWTLLLGSQKTSFVWLLSLFLLFKLTDTIWISKVSTEASKQGCYTNCFYSWFINGENM